MSAVMRAKLAVSGVSSFSGSDSLSFRAVCLKEGYPADGSDENNSFARWTPMANLTMTVNNPDLIGKFKVGDEFYVDFTPVVPA
jgi:hypothetical protein